MASVTQVTLIQNINVQQKGVDPEATEVPRHIIDMLPEDELTSDQRERATSLLGNYAAQFRAPGEPITGRTDAVLHDIDTGDNKPIQTPLRRLSPTKIQQQEVKVAEMLKGGQIGPSDSPWSSPLFQQLC